MANTCECEFALPGERKTGQILALGHSDTVWPLGTLANDAVARGEGTAVGPGRARYEERVSRSSLSPCRRCRDLDVPVARKRGVCS